MKKLCTLLLLAFFSSVAVSQQVRVSQIYGGGGTVGATYKQDFIELKNFGLSTIDISGWSVQYASATGSTWSSVTIPSSTLIEGGKHLLIGLAAGPEGSLTLPTPDLTGSFDIDMTEGKIALVNNATLLSGSVCNSPSIVHMIGYGSNASCYQGVAANTATIQNGFSLNAQCFFHANNNFDYFIVGANAKNSSYPAMLCSSNALLNVMEIGSGFNFMVTTMPGGYAKTEYLINGDFLDNYPGNIVVTAPNGWQVSLDPDNNYTNAINLPYSLPMLSNVQVFVRMPISSPGIFTGSVSNVGGGASTNANITVTVLHAEPAIQTSNIILSNITDNTMDVSWTDGDGSNRIIVVRETDLTGINFPADGKQYAANANIDAAPELNTGNLGNKVVYSGTGNSTTITGLLPGTNYTVTAFEFNGSAGTNNYLISANNYVNASTTGSPAVLLQRNFSSSSLPMYMASGASTKLPTMFRAELSNLLPNTTYRYYTQASIPSEIRTYNTGAGDPVLIDYTSNPATFTYSNAPSITTTGGYGKFKTNESGFFMGTFGFVFNNDSRFNAGDSVFPAIAVAVDGSTEIAGRYVLPQAIKVLKFGNNNGADDGSYLKGQSNATPGRLLLLYDSEPGVTSRPLSGTIIEGPSLINGGGTATWGDNFITGYDQTNGSWNTIIPNNNSLGVIMLQSLPLIPGQFNTIDCNRTNVAGTINPSSGTTPISVSAAVAPLTSGTGCAIIIPVKLSSFTVQKLTSSVKLSWSTEQEMNSREFVIERSVDGRTWVAISSIPAAGNSSTAKTYVGYDLNPVKGINYYRIRMVEQDSRFEYSITKSVLFSNVTVTTIAPNPASDIINIYTNGTGKQFNIQLLDMSGKIIRQLTSSDQHSIINVSILPRGMYFVKVIEGGNVYVSKVILQ